MVYVRSIQVDSLDWRGTLSINLSNQFEKINNLKSEFLIDERVKYYLKLFKIKEKSFRKREQRFHEFYAFFKYCPVCGSPNHIEYLRKFFFSSKREHNELRDMLLDFIENPNHLGRSVILGN